MRRPTRPFVTEYKGSGRRHLVLPTEVPHSDLPLNAQPLHQLPPLGESDDSYEAAMRAADALFSPAGLRAPDPAPNPTQPAAKDQEAGESATPPAPAAPEKTGRILQALDELPLPEMAALEAAHAPKRRGRKPGSKNKPKTPVSPVVQAEPAPRKRTLRVEPAHSEPARETARAPVASSSADAQPAVRRLDRLFAWNEKKLKPGEEWKRRRLPPVCW